MPRPRTCALSLLAAAAVASLAGCGGPAATAAGHPAAATPAPAGSPCPAAAGARLAPPPGGVWAGVNLDWEHDSPAAYTARLGRSPALYVEFETVPLGPAAAAHLTTVAAQVRAAHGMLMLTLQPDAGLAAVTPAVARDVATLLGRQNASGVPVFLRFAHEMNGSWYPWSQRPAEYVDTFRRVADAVHQLAPRTAMVWAPNYGGGYPFTGGKYAATPGSADFARLDTDSDGRLTMADDPYAPYYPGDDAVDWVGLSLYHWGARYPWGANVPPEPGKLVALLTGAYHGTAGDERAVPDFYTAFGVRHGKPVAITETAALYAPDHGGPTAAQVKDPWIAQVYQPDLAARFPRLQMINWFEWDKQESEVGTRVDWTATRQPDVLATYRAALPGWLRFADAVPTCR